MLKLNKPTDRVYFLKVAGINLILFLLVYIPTNHLLDSVSPLQPYFKWEKTTPLIDWMIIPYLSLYLLFIFPLFFLGQKELRDLGLAFALSTLVAGGLFVLFPIKPDFIRVIPDGFTTVLYRHLYKLDQARNLLPSLHVTYAGLYFLSCNNIFKSTISKILFGSWIALIVASTFFTHQHHIIDIISGIILAISTYWITIRRRHLPADQLQP